MIYQGDCLEILKRLESESIDSLVTDPPAGISFMGKDWDDDKGGRDQWIDWMTEVMRECIQVLKPGSHGLIWALPRTSHWTATALENAGFEIRDIVNHVFGSGFPKSLNVSKAIDKMKGAEREVIGKLRCKVMRGGEYKKDNNPQHDFNITSSTTPEAKQWDGWGTALKPACEHWILVRKPLSEKSIAQNVLKHGVGGINIDECRVTIGPEGHSQGRFPANFILSHNPDCVLKGEKKVKNNGGIPNAHSKKNVNPTFTSNKETSIIHYFDKDGTETVSDYDCTEGCAVKELDDQSGFLHGRRNKVIKKSIDNGIFGNGIIRKNKSSIDSLDTENGGGASRFFYCAKASRSDRNEGCESNKHPTVKSTKLMSYLIKLITPPHGIVLDPFMGSGSTGKAAIKNGFEFIGIEKESEYFEIAKARIENEENKTNPTTFSNHVLMCHLSSTEKCHV